MNKKTKLIAAVTGSLLLAGTLVLSNFNENFNFLKIFADTDEVWSHYSLVSSSFSERGIKEYWVSCKTHEISFAAPSHGSVNEGGSPSREFIDSLDKNDSRLLPKLTSNFDFETDVDLDRLFVKSKCTATYTLKDGVGVNGSRGIEVGNFYGDHGLYFSKDYLDFIFSKPEIVGLNFDFRADVECENFRHKSYNTDASGNTGTGPKNITYFSGQAGTGLTRFWKTAQFTRDMYNEFCQNPSFDGGFVIFGTTNNSDYRKIYLDNFKPVTYSEKDIVLDKIGFNQIRGAINCSGNDTLIYNSYSSSAVVKIFSANAQVSEVTIDETHKTEGVGSLHIVRNSSEFNFGIEDDIIDTAIAEGYDGITFDIMLDHVVGPANFLKYTNRTSTTQNGYGVYDTYTWYPIKCAFNDIRDTGTYDYLFQLHGTGSDASQIHNIWIDNIRPYRNTPSYPIGTTLLESFEDSNVIKVLALKSGSSELDSVYWESGSFNYSDNGEHTITTLGHDNYRDRGLSNFWFNTSRADYVSASRCYGCIDNTFSNHGVNSFRLDVTHNDGSLVNALMPSTITNTLSSGDKILIDVYTEVSGQKFGARNTGGSRQGISLIPGSWTTIELTKESASDTHFHRINEGNLAKGSYWFDNLRIQRVEPAMKFTEQVKIGYDFEEGSTRVTGTDPNLSGEYLLNGSKVFYCGPSSVFSSIDLTNAPGGREGKALKITKKDNYLPFFLSNNFYNTIPSGGTFSFDLYSTVGVNSTEAVKNFVNNSNKKVCSFDSFHYPNKWTTYTFNKADIGSDGRFLIVQGTSAGDFYFDNIKINGFDVYKDKGTFYSDLDGFIEIDTGITLPDETAIFLDDVPVTYYLEGTVVKLITNTVSNGEHRLTFDTKNNSLSKNSYVFAFAKYMGTSVVSANASLTYGSQGYQTITNIPNDTKQIVCNNKSIAFERTSSGILIPDAALVECLKTNGAVKQTGTLVMQVISGNFNNVVTELRYSITLSGDSTILSGYAQRSNETFETFGYSSTGAGTNHELNYEENLLEYQRCGFDNVYEQLVNLPAIIPEGYFSDNHTNNNRNYQDIVRCEKLGLGFVMSDEYTLKLCGETGSVYNKSILIKEDKNNPSNNVYASFVDETALYNALKARFELFTSFTCLKKLVLCDEPRWKNIQASGEVYKQARRALTDLGRSDIEVNVNLLPISAGWDDDGIGPKSNSQLQNIETKKKNQYTAYLDKWIQYSGADYVCFDIYPLNTYLYNSATDYKDNRSGVDIWFNLNMVVAANYCKSNGLELHCVTQSCCLTGRQDGNNTRILSMDDIRWLNNMLMGYGVDQISYFTYYARHEHGLSDEFGEENYGSPMYENETTGEATKTNVWYDYQTMLGEMNDFAPIVKNFVYQGSRYFKAGSCTEQGNGYDFVTSFDDSNFNNFGNVSNFSIDNGYALFTALRDNNGKYMQMVQNICDPMYDQRVQTATITFNSSCTYAEVFENGSSRIVKLDGNHKLQLKLSSGNAAYVIAF